MTDKHVIENNLDLYQAVGRLPDRLRLTVVMFALGMTQREIADELGVSQPVICERLENAKDVLKDLSKTLQSDSMY